MDSYSLIALTYLLKIKRQSSTQNLWLTSVKIFNYLDQRKTRNGATPFLRINENRNLSHEKINNEKEKVNETLNADR